MMTKHVIQPQRLRQIEGSFAFIPHRFLRGGFFASLSCEQLALYLFFLLVADSQGLSYYHPKTIRQMLPLSQESYDQAFHGLIEKELIATEGRLVQVLRLPESLPASPPD